MASKTLEDLFIDCLRQTYFAEQQIARALAKMVKVAGSKELARAFEKHRDETHVQLARLEQIFDRLGRSARAEPSLGIQGILGEASEFAAEFRDSDALDAALIAVAQAVEHYEITRYGSLSSWAMDLGLKDTAKLLDETLEEEKKTDKLLTQLAEQRVNKRAA
jgi:ferritin-like metal-binding protein YciE